MGPDFGESLNKARSNMHAVIALSFFAIDVLLAAVLLLRLIF
jgi:hypothetical protein